MVNLDNSDEEIWKDIPEFEGIYQVSNKARVKSLKRWVKGRWPNSLHPVKERILKHHKDEHGYYFYGLSKDNLDWTMKEHRLVAEAFIPNYCQLPLINHINGIRTDNRIENLEWVTHSYNVKDGFNRGRIPSNLGWRKPKPPKIPYVRPKNNSRSKKLAQLNMQGEVIKIWPSARECARNGMPGALRAARHGGICKGYLWKYAEN